MALHCYRHLSAVVGWLVLLLGVLGGSAGAATLGGGLGGGGGAGGGDVVEFETAWSATGGEVGEPVALAIRMEVEEGYSVTSHQARQGFAGAAELEVEVVEASEGLEIEGARFPQPHMKQVGPDELSVVDGTSYIYLPMVVRGGEVGETLRATVAVHWQACDDRTCLRPQTTELEVELPVVGPGEAAEANAEMFAAMGEAEAAEEGPAVLNLLLFGWSLELDATQLWLLLPVAAVGGFLLNLTPCVLPLIPIKVMGLAQAAGTRRRTFALGLVVFAGVVSFWLVLGLLISLASGFLAANQLFQYPAFTIGVGVFIAVMALGLCGMFSVQLPQWVYRINPSQDTVHGSFGFGIMIAVLSTPCTAPFMGAAAGAAATQGPGVAMAAFAAIGVGMALPYVVLAAFPQLTDRMPRVGPASELIKQVMGLLLLAAGFYFLGTGLSGLLAEPGAASPQFYWWAVGGAIAVAGAWLTWRTLRIERRVWPRAIFAPVGVVLMGAGVWLGMHMTAEGPIDWAYYTPERFEEALERGDVVVLEFTAEWCLNCKLLEETVLRRADVVEWLNGEGVTAMKVDLTGNNPQGNEKLVELGARMIPLLAVFDPSGERVFQSEWYTAQQVIDAIAGAGPELEPATAER